MYLKKFTVVVTIRIVLLLVTMIVFAVIAGRADLFFSQVILGVLIVWQTLGLITCVRRTNRDLAKFLLSIENNDLTVHFEHHHDPAFEPLHTAFKDIVSTYRQVGTEREVQYHYLKLLVDHANVGVISRRGNDDIGLINQAALDLLRIDTYHHWQNLARHYPTLAEAVDQLPDGERTLVTLSVGHEVKRLSVQVSAAVLMGESYQIITFQDIEKEINQSELNAYQKLIRVLTHEIMNSVTPIASLSETLLMMLDDAQGRAKPLAVIGESYQQELSRSLRTINRRSDGLLHFVEDYRKLTKLPQPNPEVLSVPLLLQSLAQLMQAELQQQQVALSVQVEPETLQLYADRRLVEQVLINLITNSLQGVSERDNAHIKLRSYTVQQQVVIEVVDNGTGIAPEKIDQVFVPFFSTKPEGSGIGLSLSRQIMTLHRGTIRVQSQPNESTRFFLYFPAAPLGA